MKENFDRKELEDNEHIQEIEFISEDQKLKGKLFFPEQLQVKQPGVIFIHGWKSNQNSKTDYASTVAGLGYVSMTFDLRGHGESEGDLPVLTMENFIHDGEAAYDRLIAEHAVDADDITIVGNSLGAYIAIRLIERKNSKNLIIQAPANYPDQELTHPLVDYAGDKSILEWRKQILKPKTNAALDALNKFKGNLLVVESQLDDFIPHQTVENYVSAAQDPARVKLEIMADAPHSLKDPSLRMQYQKLISDFLLDKSPIKS
ncbi:MAG: hypothetical protein A2908_01295 [Candidatus Staskawiczbacteria bacterium RIFCSPLOWO2_01_FULL_38_12b]|uniref:Serine aminopeptidase S33 domain-containing protein n=1 Tax=Candidatus Staskawiczbacteria bacterium RIFCSPLOWO2_01_FULL_38_12b TaxID=1802214 RepID=A0A1G2IGB9_9BACT|nr:MAG: hypothetical protein A2908_01295 [Candidatus Staskawiczbacteria bacterium RIFCSPLOWO2_01_FULL_38_12b]